MTDIQITLLGWALFVVSAAGFCIASIGNFRAMSGSAFLLLACLVFLIPFPRPGR